MSSFHRMLAAAALLVGVSGAAHALELFTPVSQGVDSFIGCTIVNVGTRPIEVSARLQRFPDGSDISSGGLPCPVPPATLAPGEGCLVGTLSFGQLVRGYCHFTTTSSKVRADLLVYDNSTLAVTSTLPATK
jgi:hypothetical protein